MLSLLHNDDLGKLILRLNVAGLILFHGIAKLMNPDLMNWIASLLAGHDLPHFLAYGVLLGEIVAPLMAIVGWHTRIAAILMVGNMLIALFLAHTDMLLSLNGSDGWALELQGLFLFGALALVFLGSGRMAIQPD